MTTVYLKDGKPIIKNDDIGISVNCCCNITGRCCEYFCLDCRYCYFQWSGPPNNAYVLIGQAIGNPCPTTQCPDCPATAAESPIFPIVDYIPGVDFVTITFCCPYPDSEFFCFNTASPLNCNRAGSVWKANASCGNTPEEIQQQCAEQIFP